MIVAQAVSAPCCAPAGRNVPTVVNPRLVISAVAAIRASWSSGPAYMPTRRTTSRLLRTCPSLSRNRTTASRVTGEMYSSTAARDGGRRQLRVGVGKNDAGRRSTARIGRRPDQQHPDRAPARRQNSSRSRTPWAGPRSAVTTGHPTRRCLTTPTGLRGRGGSLTAWPPARPGRGPPHTYTARKTGHPPDARGEFGAPGGFGLFVLAAMLVLRLPDTVAFGSGGGFALAADVGRRVVGATNGGGQPHDAFPLVEHGEGTVGGDRIFIRPASGGPLLARSSAPGRGCRTAASWWPWSTGRVDICHCPRTPYGAGSSSRQAGLWQ